MKKKYTSMLLPADLYKLQQKVIKETGMSVSALYKQAFRAYINAESHDVEKKYLITFHNQEEYIKRTDPSRYFADEKQEMQLEKIREQLGKTKVLSPIKLQAIHNYLIKMANELEIEYTII